MRPFIPLIFFLATIIVTAPNPDNVPMIHFVADKDTVPLWLHIDTTKPVFNFSLTEIEYAYDFVFMDSAGAVLSYGGKYKEKKKLYVRDSLAAIKCLVQNYFLMNRQYMSADSARRALIREKTEGVESSYTKSTQPQHSSTY